MEIALSSQLDEYWFGFSVNSTGQATAKDFRLNLPAAAKGLMLISLPADAELSAEGLVVEKVATITELLPSDWNSDNAFATTSTLGSQWWKLNISGISQVELSVIQNPANSLAKYRHLVKNLRLDHALASDAMLTHARFVIERTAESTSALHIAVDKRTKIKEVLIDGMSAEWQVINSLSSSSNLIELSSESRTEFSADNLDETMVDIEAMTRVDKEHATELQLPDLSIADAFVMKGETYVFGLDGVVIDRLEAPDCRLSRQTLASNIAQWELDPAGGLAWKAAWLGRVPKITIGLSRSQQNWIARSLTRFAVQPEWLSATCRLRIDSKHVTSNEIRLRVGQNWFVDDVRLITAGSDLRSRLEDREGAQNPVILVGWDGKRNSVAIELEVVAHSPRDKSGEFINLRTPRLVTLPGADQIDNYVIESSNRFGVQLDANLLKFQRQPVELPDWQQQLLPKTVDKWIFQGTRSAVPPIKLVASEGAFSAQILTIVSRAPAAFNVEYAIDCLPVAGVVDSVRVLLPNGMAATDLTWSFAPEEQDSAVDVQAFPIGSSGSSQSRLIEVNLPNAMSGPFRLTATSSLSLIDGNRLSLPILSVPMASNGESKLVLPRTLANPQGPGSIEILPATLCCSESALHDRLFDFSRDDLQTLVAARLETGVSSRLELIDVTQPSSTDWIWRESIEHVLFDDGGSYHKIEWLVETTVDGSVEVHLPIGWKLVDAFLDNQRLHVDGDASALIRIDLPPQNTTKLRLNCESPGSRSRWIERHRILRPVISLPVLESSEGLWLAPSRTSLDSLHSRPEVSKLAERLLPTQWWHWLAPHGTYSGTTNADEYPGWTFIELSRQNRQNGAEDLASLPESLAKNTQTLEIWSINRTAFSAIALALVMAMSSLIWLVLGSSPRIWWLVLSAAAVTIILIPAKWLACGQLLMLSVAVAGLIKLANVVILARLPGLRVRGGSAIFKQASGLETLLVFALLWLMSGTSACAQTRSAGFSRAPVPGNDTGKLPEVFTVLIPVDEKGEVSGPYAYTPTRLWNLLSNPASSSPGPTPPRLLSADYSLRTRSRTFSQSDQVQELSVEFRVRVDQADVEIQLPFLQSDVRLLRGFEDGEELWIGGRSLSQQSKAIVYRPSSTGTIRLNLQLEPTALTDVGNDTRLQLAIPRIPTATLRLAVDDTTTYELRSISGSRKTISTAITELLGPADRLDILWTTNNLPKATNRAPVEIYSDTWVHASGSQLLALCQVRLAHGAGLPRELHLYAEPGWEPVGTLWQDGELVSTEYSSIGNRRVYKVRIPASVSEVEPVIVRTVLVPRDTESTSSLSLPFFSIQEASPQSVTRTLAWSTEGALHWKPDGLDYWQEVYNMPGLTWGSLGLQTAPKLYHIPLGSMATALRRLTPTDNNSVDEITQVHLGLAESKIDYRAQCQIPDTRPLVLTIPSHSRIDSLLLDSNIPKYRISERGQETVLEIFPNVDSGKYQVISLELSQSNAPGKSTNLPRIVLRDFAVNTSIYRLLLGAGLECDLQSDTDLQLIPVEVPPSKLLANLESMLGQADLGGDYRDSAMLPVEYKIHQRAPIANVASVLFLNRTDQGWKAHMESVWETGDKPLDFVFYELPSVLRDAVTAGQLPLSFVPMGNSSMTTMCVIPPPPVEGRTRVVFDILLPSSVSSQALAVPQINAMSATPERPLLALPASIDNQPVRWLRTGRRLEVNMINSLLGPPSDEFQYFAMEGLQTQVNWKARERDDKLAELLMTNTCLLSKSDGAVNGAIDYWIQPAGRVDLSIDLPIGCKVVGAELAGSPAIWYHRERGIRVLLQPNYAPVRLRLLLHWQTAHSATASEEHWTLRLPTLHSVQREIGTAEVIENRIASVDIEGAQAISRRDYGQQDFAEFWAELLLNSIPIFAGKSSEETIAWLAGWHPQLVQLDLKTRLDASKFTGRLDSSGAVDATVDVDWFWNAFCADAGLTEDQVTMLEVGLPIHSGIGGDLANIGRVYTRSDPIERLELRSLDSSSGMAARLTAAGFMSAAALLALVLAGRTKERYFAALSLHPWIYWLQLAMAAWLLLPVAWPAGVLLLTTLGMIVSQSLDSRRRHRLLSNSTA
jgi:hypothetical protein